jgi:hypothetical protein
MPSRSIRNSPADWLQVRCVSSRVVELRKARDSGFGRESGPGLAGPGAAGRLRAARGTAKTSAQKAGEGAHGILHGTPSAWVGLLAYCRPRVQNSALACPESRVFTSSATHTRLRAPPAPKGGGKGGPIHRGFDDRSLETAAANVPRGSTHAPTGPPRPQGSRLDGTHAPAVEDEDSQANIRLVPTAVSSGSPGRQAVDAPTVPP